MKSQTEIQQLNVLDKILQVPAFESWILLDNSSDDIEKTIILMEWAKLDFYSSRTSGALNLRIVHQGSGSFSQIRCGFHALENGNIEATIKSSFEADNSTSEIHMLSLAESGGEVLLDSAIEISEWIQKILGSLNERHIFLGSGGKIRGIPALVVHSDDIEASHALAIDRISDEELFYLRSRGFNRDDATGLLLDGAVSAIFSGLSELDEKMYNNCKEKVLKI